MPWLEQRWLGGRIFQDANGKKTYHIRQQRNGKRYEISTRCHTEAAAQKFLVAFEKDPLGFRAAALATAPDSLILTDGMIEAFCFWSLNVKHNIPHWVNRQRGILKWWKVQLGNRDLRRVTLQEDIDPKLIGAPARQHKIAVIKTLYGYLRKVTRRITNAEDPTLDLVAPQAKPQQWKKNKVIPLEHEQAIIAGLRAPYSDVVRVIAATGCHVSEVLYFATHGDVQQRGSRFILILPHTKGGGTHPLDVSKETAEAGKRLLAVKHVSESNLRKAFQAFCKTKGTKGWAYTPGMFRHTYATRMIEAGATPEDIAKYLHHKSAVTTMRFYATYGVVPRPRLPSPVVRGAPRGAKRRKVKMIKVPS